MANTLETAWLCEKWSEDAVVYARAKLANKGITKQFVGWDYIPTNRINRAFSELMGRPVGGFKKRPRFLDISKGISSASLREIVGKPDLDIVAVPGNLMLNEGIQRLEDLLIGAGGTTYANANAYIGVGDTNTAEAATQTELQATANASNRFYKAMNATFPSRSSQTLSFQSDFDSGEANFAWAEWTIAAGATSASGSGFLVGTTNLNRKVQSLGTKATGTWTFTGTITIS